MSQKWIRIFHFICQAVQEARRLMDKDLLAKSDPYCIIKCGPEGFLSQNVDFGSV